MSYGSDCKSEEYIGGSLLTFGLPSECTDKRMAPKTPYSGEQTKQSRLKTPRGGRDGNQQRCSTDVKQRPISGNAPSAPKKAKSPSVGRKVNKDLSRCLEFEDDDALVVLRSKSETPPAINSKKTRKHMQSAWDTPGKGSKDKEELFKSPEPTKRTKSTYAIPVLYGTNVTVESPDPMSKFNSNNQAAPAYTKHKLTRTAQLLSECKQDLANISSISSPEVGLPPDAISPDSIMADLDDHTRFYDRSVNVTDEVTKENIAPTSRSIAKAPVKPYPMIIPSTEKRAVRPQPLQESRSTNSLSEQQSRKPLSSLSTSSLPTDSPTTATPSPPSGPSPKPPSSIPAPNQILRKHVRYALNLTPVLNAEEPEQPPIQPVPPPPRDQSDADVKDTPVVEATSALLYAIDVDAAAPAPVVSDNNRAATPRQTPLGRPSRPVVTRRRRKREFFFVPKLESLLESEEIALGIPQHLLHDIAENHASNRVVIHNNKEAYDEWLLDQIPLHHPINLSASLTPEEMRRNETSTLMNAIIEADSDTFKETLNNNEKLLFCRDENGNTPLIIATAVGWKKAIRLLLKRGADVNAQNRFGNTSLHYACLHESDEIQNYLRRKNALSSIRNERGFVA